MSQAGDSEVVECRSPRDEDGLGPAEGGGACSDGEDAEEDEVESPFRDAPEGFLRLRPSCVPSLPPTIFVDYPPELGIRRNDSSELVEMGDKKAQYKSYWERICIRNAFKRAGFSKGGKKWTAMWAKHPTQSQLDGLNCLQKVNHFPGSWCIGRKDRLSRTLQTMKRLHGKEFDFHPETFVLPGDKESFQRAIKSDSENSTSHKKSLWIVKPCASSCGRGIHVATASQALAIGLKKKVLIQKYLANPCLINNKKFDLRIYILVTGVDPLRVYVHEEGLTRISTSDFSLNNISNKFAHLTNYSINKKAEVFKAAEYDSNGVENDTSETEGFKWSLKAFKNWLTAKVGQSRMEEVFENIYSVCVKTMIAAEGDITPQLQRSVSFRTNCFELFGCDVILDRDLTPHLLEVNVSPSLMGSSPLDKRIKGMLIADVLHTVGLYPHDTDLLDKYSADGQKLDGNPFGFCNLTKLMACQDAYRRNPSSSSVDFSLLKNIVDDSNGMEYCNWWQMLVMIEDEFARSKSGGFRLLHPTQQNASKYTSLYRNPRFSDQFLAKWVAMGGIRGRALSFLPSPVKLHFPGHSNTSVKLGMPLAPKRPKSATLSRPTSGVISSGDKRPSSAAKLRATVHQQSIHTNDNIPQQPKEWTLMNRINRNIADYTLINPS